MRRASVPWPVPIRQDERPRCVFAAAMRRGGQASASRDRHVRFRGMSGADAPVQSVSLGARNQRHRARRARPDSLRMIRRAAVVSVRLGRRLSASGGPVRQARRGPVRGQKVMIVHGRRINAAGLRSAVKSPLRTLRRVRLRRSPCLLKSALSDGPRASGQHAPLTSRVKKWHRSAKRRRTPVFGLPS